MAGVVGPARGASRPRGDTEGDRGGPRPGRVPAAEAGVPVHGRDGAALAARARATAAGAAVRGERRFAVPQRVVAPRPGAGPGPLPAHAPRVAEEGLDARPPGRRPGRPVGGVGGRDRDGPPAGVERVPVAVDPPRAAGRITSTRTTPRMTSSARSWRHPDRAILPTTCSLEGTVPGPSRTTCIGSWTCASARTSAGSAPILRRRTWA